MSKVWHGLALFCLLGWLGCSTAPRGDVAKEGGDSAAAAATGEAKTAAAAATAAASGSTMTKQFLMKTSLGELVLELDVAKAPKTSANFERYVAKGHYNGTIFHRVISGFMIQGGGMTADMAERPTDPPVENEAVNGLKNARGTVAMARTSAVHSATSQFFINVVDNDFLNFRSPDPQGFGYCVFGRVVKGMETVDAIRNVPTSVQGMHRDVPVTPVVIESVTPLP